ncbi:Hypothetical predicted protein, partial [Xyrichtys novacula]
MLSGQQTHNSGLDRLHVSALGPLHIRITTEPQLANESQALTARRMPANKLWECPEMRPRTVTLDISLDSITQLHFRACRMEVSAAALSQIR